MTAEGDEVEPAPVWEGGPLPPPAGDTAPIPIERISTTPVEVPSTTGDAQARQEQAMLRHKLDEFKHELGWLGHTFGGRREKPGSISALVIVMCFVIIIGAFLLDVYVKVQFPNLKPEMPLSFEKLFAGVTSLITLVLGYLFGSNDRNDK